VAQLIIIFGPCARQQVGPQLFYLIVQSGVYIRFTAPEKQYQSEKGTKSNFLAFWVGLVTQAM
jgi:hypothetical protein